MNPELEKYLLEKYTREGLQGEREAANQSQFANNILAAGSVLNNGDTSFYQNLNKQSDNRVRDYLEGLKNQQGMQFKMDQDQQSRDFQLQRDDANRQYQKTQADETRKYQEGQSNIDFERQKELAKLKHGQQKELKDLTNKANAAKPKEAKPNQSMAAAYGKRIEQAINDMENLSSKGFDRTDVLSGIGSYMPDAVRSDEALSQDQAERNFINAVLRRESGASISDTEFANAEKQYFPRVGDGPETLAQKKRNREQVLASLKAEAGPAWNQVESVSSSFPKTVRNPETGQIAQVSNEAELQEARGEGFVE